VGNLTSRILVAALLLPVALGSLWAGGWWLVALGVVAGVIAMHELCSMAREQRPVVLAGHAGVVACIVLAHLEGAAGLALALGPALLLTFILAAASPVEGRSSLTSMAVTVFGIAWIGIGLGAVVVLRDGGFTVVLAVLLGTWASDIGAYAIGRMIGRRRLAPAISPGKSVEGFVAGVVVGTAVVWWVLYGQHVVGTFDGVIVGLVVALAGPFGDLLESFVKRDVGVKDSGTILAGHGGVLDRIDAMLLTAPLALLALWALGASA
jgi:phosphatidate cytidylyltransferase